MIRDWFRRVLGDRPVAPDEAVTGLDRDERVLAWAETTEGDYFVATPRGLHITGDGETRLVGWHLVSKAVWQDHRLTITEADEVPGTHEIRDRAPWIVQFDEPGSLAVVIRQRVERTVHTTRYHRLVAGGGVRVVGRRVPGHDGLVWQYRLDMGVNPNDPGVVEEVEAAIAAEVDAAVPKDL